MREKPNHKPSDEMAGFAEEAEGSDPAAALEAWFRCGEMLLEEAGVTRDGELVPAQRPGQEDTEGKVRDLGGAAFGQDGAGGEAPIGGLLGQEPYPNGEADPNGYAYHRDRLQAMSERYRAVSRQGRIVAEVLAERRRQDEKYPAERPGCAVPDDFMLSVARNEFWEVVFAPDAANRREEVVQLAAVCLKWLEIMDARGPG